MNSKIGYLRLPQLPDDLFVEIKNIASVLEPDETGRQWVEQLHGYQINAVSQVYGRANTNLPIELQTEIHNIYYPYFGVAVTGVVGNLTNVSHTSFAQSPPHCDRMRNVAINYIMQTGGSTVLTCFYKTGRQGTDTSTAMNALYSEVELDFKVQLPEKRWHTFNVQQYHSVEHIEHTRLIFSLILDSNPDIETFKTRYNDLFE
jgi:hypothetical protein